MLRQRRLIHTLRSTLLIPSQNQNLTTVKKTTPAANDKASNKSIGCQILENNGFITTGSGVTTNGSVSYLPAGKRVLNKLIQLVREEMNSVGGQEIEMPALADIAIWQKTQRDKLMGSELFKLSDRHGRAMCLCPTHEELVTSLVSRYGKQVTVKR